MGRDGTRVASPIPADSSLGGICPDQESLPAACLPGGRRRGGAGRQRTAGRSRQASGRGGAGALTSRPREDRRCCGAPGPCRAARSGGTACGLVAGTFDEDAGLSAFASPGDLAPSPAPPASLGLP